MRKALVWSLIALPPALSLLLMALKLANVITWSWWLVALPALLQVAIVVIACLTAFGYIWKVNRDHRHDREPRDYDEN